MKTLDEEIRDRMSWLGMVGAALVLTAAGIILTLAAHAPASAQTPEPLTRGLTGSGARAIALGDAYYALGGDFQSMAYNPAGIGLARRIRMEGSFTHRSMGLTSRYFGNPTSADLTSTGLDVLGIVYPLATDRGSMVVAMGAYRIRDLDARYEVEGYNTSADPEIGETWVWASERDRGALYGYSAGISVETAPGFYVGGSLEATAGSDAYTYRMEATDTEDVWTPYWGHDYDDGITYTYRGKGLRLSVGGLWRPLPILSLGGSIRLPQTIQVTENWFQNTVLYYDDDTEESFAEDGIFDYDLRMPYVFGFGGALHLGGLTLTGGGTYVDYTQAEFSKLRFDGDDPDYFLNNYKPEWHLGGGIEFSGIRGWSFRGGYQWAPLLFRPDGLQVPRNREVYTFGVGLPIDPTVSLDLTYRTAGWETFVGDTSERWQNSQVVIGFAYRF